MESRPGQLLPLSSTSTSGEVDTQKATAQQKRILDKVWARAEVAMGSMKTALLDRLKEPGMSVEEVERSVE